MKCFTSFELPGQRVENLLISLVKFTSFNWIALRNIRRRNFECHLVDMNRGLSRVAMTLINLLHCDSVCWMNKLHFSRSACSQSWESARAYNVYWENITQVRVSSFEDILSERRGWTTENNFSTKAPSNISTRMTDERGESDNVESIELLISIESSIKWRLQVETRFPSRTWKRLTNYEFSRFVLKWKHRKCSLLIFST